MKRSKILASAFVIFCSFQIIEAAEIQGASITITPAANVSKYQAVTLGQLLTTYFDTVGQSLPDSYADIQLKFTNIPKTDGMHAALQKGVMMGLIKNVSISLHFLSTKVTEDALSILAKKRSQIDLPYIPGQWLSQSRLTELAADLPDYFTRQTSNVVNNQYSLTQIKNFEILEDVYQKLKTQHIQGSSFNDEQLIQGAIQGMTRATEDEHTTYFPPTEATEFNDELNGEFEGIGAYVEMTEPGKLMVVSPLENSPALKAGIKAGDQILKIDDFEITMNTDLNTAISKIKGPANTSVVLVITRDGQKLTLTVKREKIIIHFVTSKKLENNDYYIQITQFGMNMYADREKAVQDLKNQTNVRNIIIDLRNNPGGSLDEVIRVLHHFIPKGQPSLIVKSIYGDQVHTSQGSELYTFEGKKIIFLINAGSASAAEILVTSVKDYYPNTVIIGEQSYGKGSVQSLYDYADGSSFKLTIAKRFSGKTQSSIDTTGIIPNQTVENLSTTTLDEQLQAAMNVR